MIVIGHCAGNYRNDGALFRIINVGYLVVAVFFYFSGYGVMCSARSKEDYIYHFWQKRLLRLFIPFLLVHIPYIIVKSAFGQIFSPIDFWGSALGLCTIVDNSWYVTAVIPLYCSFWISAKLFAFSSKWQKRCLFICIVAVTGIESLIFMQNQDWWVISNLAFLIGAISLDFSWGNKTVWITSLLMLFFGEVLMPLSIRTIGYHDIVYVISCNIISSATAIVIGSCISGTGNRVTRFLGKISYEIYLIHGLFIYVLGQMDELPFIRLTLLTLMGSIMSAIALHKVDEILIRKVKKY